MTAPRRTTFSSKLGVAAWSLPSFAIRGRRAYQSEGTVKACACGGAAGHTICEFRDRNESMCHERLNCTVPSKESDDEIDFVILYLNIKRAVTKWEGNAPGPIVVSKWNLRSGFSVSLTRSWTFRPSAHFTHVYTKFNAWYDSLPFPRDSENDRCGRSYALNACESGQAHCNDTTSGSRCIKAKFSTPQQRPS